MANLNQVTNTYPPSTSVYTIETTGNSFISVISTASEISKIDATIASPGPTDTTYAIHQYETVYKPTKTVRFDETEI